MEHYLRPKDTMAHCLPPTLANEVVRPVDPRRVRERQHQTQRAATLVQDDALWKELQQELAKSKVVSRAAIQEITRNFINKRQVELDAQTKKSEEEGTISPRNRRNSNDLEYSRRSSLTIITEKGRNFRRAMSLGNEEQQRFKGGRRDSVIRNFVSSSFSMMSYRSVDNLSLLEVRTKKCSPASTRRRSDCNFLDVLDQTSAMSISNELSDMTGSRSLSSKSSSKRCLLKFSSGVLDTHLETCTDDEIARDGISSCDEYDSSNDDADGELLVLFPSKPRRQTQKNTKPEMARTA